MKQPKFTKGTEVSVKYQDVEHTGKVLNIFPVAFSKEGRPIIKAIDKIAYSYQIDTLKSIRFNEDELTEKKTTTKK